MMDFTFESNIRKIYICMSIYTIAAMGVLLFAALLVIGLVLAYGGLPLYFYTMFTIGAIISAGAFYLFTAPAELFDYFGMIVIGTIGGVVFVFAHILAVLVIGFSIGWIVPAVVGFGDLIIQIAGGFIGATLSIAMYLFVVILGTAGIGAFVVAKTVSAGPGAGLGMLVATPEDAPVFWLVFITGAIVQFGFLVLSKDEETDETSENSGLREELSTPPDQTSVSDFDVFKRT